MGDKRIREVFNVEAERRAYMAFIDRLRDQLKGNRLVCDRLVLPSSEEVVISEDPRFEIVLQTNKPSEITLLLRRHDLYAEAYRNGSGTWLEFSTPNQVEHVIPGSEFLGFHGSYTASHGIEAAAGRGRDRIGLGRDDLRDAVNNLAASVDTEERARSLIVVIQMTAESIRLDEVLFFSLDNYVEGRGAVPGPLLLELENSWGILSKCLGYDGHDEDINFFPITYTDGITHRRFITQKQAIGALGMLSSAVKSINVHTPLPRSVVGGNYQGAGRPLAAVFLVKITEMDFEYPWSNIYGTITVADNQRTQIIYNRGREEAEMAQKGLILNLTGPSEACISASDQFYITVDIKDRDRITGDDIIGKGKFYWSSGNSSNKFDKLLTKDFFGEDGKVTVSYAVFSDAVQARVEVKLINTDNEKRPVYGTLTASYDVDGGLGAQVFHKDRGWAVDVRPQQLIPLNISIIPVPLGSDLKISGKLFDRDERQYLADHVIAWGDATFPPQLSGTSEQIISGEHGSIQLKVTWIP